MYFYRNILLPLSFILCFVVILGFSSGIEVHTEDRVQAEYGESTTISCTYTPPSSLSDFIQLVWAKDGNTILYTQRDSVVRAGRYSLSSDFVSSGNLTINEVLIQDEGAYQCEVSIDGFLPTRSEVSLEVIAVPSLLVLQRRVGDISVIINESAVTLKQGFDVEFECQAHRSRPSVTIDWYFDGALKEAGLGSQISTTNLIDDGFHDTISSFVMTNPSRAQHGKLLECKVVMDGKIVTNASIVLYVEEPPDQPITILGIADHLTSSTPQKPVCIAGGSFPSSYITWSLDGENVTDNAAVTTMTMESGTMRVMSELEYVPQKDDYGKVLRCIVSHVALEEDIVAEKAVCLIDTEMTITSIEGDFNTSLLLQLSGIPHSASCSLDACSTTTGSAPGTTQSAKCIQRDLGTRYSDFVGHVYELDELLASTTYDVSLRCRHRLCGESVTSTRATVASSPDASEQNAYLNPPETHSGMSGNVWLRDLIFVIIAVIVVCAFVIVVTVTVVLRAVVKGSIRSAGGQEGNHVTRSPDRVGLSRASSVSSSLRHNLYTIEEAYEGDPKIYQEIKDSRSGSLVHPSDIMVSTKLSEQERNNLSNSMRLSMRHPRPPPLPPLTNRISVDKAFMTASGSTESEKDDYVPMSPDTYSIYSVDSEYMDMKGTNTN